MEVDSIFAGFPFISWFGNDVPGVRGIGRNEASYLISGIAENRKDKTLQ
jgi:hypothetical protein